MGSTSDLRVGAIIKHNNENYVVVDHKHVTPGKGHAHHQVKMRGLTSGRIQEVRYSSGEKIEFVRVEHHDYQYLYNDGHTFYFMNMETFDQVPVNEESLSEGVEYMKENQDVKIAFEGDIVLSVEIPQHVNLKVDFTEPGVKGDTATNALKPATLETGVSVQVPLFINDGDKIRVDTRTGAYIERVKE